jgi:hypothetical protein
MIVKTLSSGHIHGILRFYLLVEILVISQLGIMMMINHLSIVVGVL